MCGGESPASAVRRLRRPETTLYVGDLDATVSSPDLFHVFSQAAKISGVHLCVDSLTGNSLGYGYVNFVSPMEALKAMSRLNYTCLRGKPMRIMRFQKEPTARKISAANLFIKNLDRSITSAQLHALFHKYGTILSCKVGLGEDGQSKGFGFVQYEKDSSASDALTAMHGKVLGQKKLYVARFMTKNQRMEANDENFTNLYVKNLGENVTEDSLKERFAEFGTVSQVVIMRDAKGESKGFGFVSFELPEEAKKALEALNGALLGLKVKPRDEIIKREKEISNIFQQHATSSIYVRYLDQAVDETMLESHCKGYGQVISAKVIRDKGGASKGFGFVWFSSPLQAHVALAKLQGTILMGRKLFVAPAKREKIHYQRVLENDHHNRVQFHSPTELDISPYCPYNSPAWHAYISFLKSYSSVLNFRGSQENFFRPVKGSASNGVYKRFGAGEKTRSTCSCCMSDLIEKVKPNSDTRNVKPDSSNACANKIPSRVQNQEHIPAADGNKEGTPGSPTASANKIPSRVQKLGTTEECPNVSF